VDVCIGDDKNILVKLDGIISGAASHKLIKTVDKVVKNGISR